MVHVHDIDLKSTHGAKGLYDKVQCATHIYQEAIRKQFEALLEVADLKYTVHHSSCW